MERLTDLMQAVPIDVAHSIAQRVHGDRWSEGAIRFSSQRPGTLYCTLHWFLFGRYAYVMIDWWRRMGFVTEVCLHVCHSTYMGEGWEGHPYGLPHVLTMHEQRLVSQLQRIWHPIPVILEHVCPQVGRLGPFHVQHPLCSQGRLADNTSCPCCDGDCFLPSQDRPDPERWW